VFEVAEPIQSPALAGLHKESTGDTEVNLTRQP